MVARRFSLKVFTYRLAGCIPSAYAMSEESAEKRSFIVIPSGARDLLFAIDRGKSRFLVPFKKQTALGMTFMGILSQGMKPFPP